MPLNQSYIDFTPIWEQVDEVFQMVPLSDPFQMRTPKSIGSLQHNTKYYS